jgi:hypothetical protein
VTADIHRFPGFVAAPQRRASARLDVDGRLIARLVKPNLAVDVRDIGFGGMAIETNGAFRPGACHQFHLMTDTGLSVMIWATAIYCRDGGDATHHGPRYVSGWRFDVLPVAEPDINRIMDAVTR